MFKGFRNFYHVLINSLRPSDAYMRQCHYQNQCWNIVNKTLRNKLQWNFNRNSNIFIQENAFESVVCEEAAILSRPQCVNYAHWLLAVSKLSPLPPFPHDSPAMTTPSVVCWLITGTAKCNYLTIHWLPWNSNEADRIMFSGYKPTTNLHRENWKLSFTLHSYYTDMRGEHVQYCGTILSIKQVGSASKILGNTVQWQW